MESQSRNLVKEILDRRTQYIVDHGYPPEIICISRKDLEIISEELGALSDYYEFNGSFLTLCSMKVFVPHNTNEDFPFMVGSFK